MPDYMNWLPDFSNLPLPKTDQEKKVEERKQKARLESGIVTANDKYQDLIKLNLKKSKSLQTNRQIVGTGLQLIGGGVGAMFAPEIFLPYFAVEGGKGLMDENGIKRTTQLLKGIDTYGSPSVNKLKETGEIATTPKLGKATLSGLGDALNLSMFVLPGSRQVKEIITAAKSIPNGLMKIKRTIPYSIGIPHNEKNAYRILHQIEAEDILNGSPLRLGKTNPAKIAFDADKMLHLKSNKGIILLFKSGAEHGGRKLFSKGAPWEGTTVTNGTPWYLEMPGNNLPWVKGRHYRNPQGIRESGSVVFEEAPIGSHIDLLADIETGLTNIFPSLIPGSTIYKPTSIKYIYKKIPVHPHQYIYQKKSGGILNYLNFFK